MDGMESSLSDGTSPTYNSPRRTTGQHDLLIVLDIPDHSYIDGLFKTEIEQMATKAKLVRCRGQGFYNEDGNAPDMVSIDPWSVGQRTPPSAYPGGDVVSQWWATAWVKGESDGWFKPLRAPKYTPTWLQISGVSWFFGFNARYQTNIVWNIRNGLKPNWSLLQEYEKVAKQMQSALLFLAPK